MAGYKLQGKTASGTMVDIPLAATYDAAGNDIQEHYAAIAEYEAIMAKLELMDDKLDVIRGVSVPDFADASWGEINKYSQKGLAASLWKVGDEKKIALTSGETITMVILGFDHDNLTGGGKAGITLGMKNALATAYVMNDSSTNAGGWKQSKMRTSTMETLYGLLPDEVKAVIKPVDKVTALYESSGALETTSDKLFLFSQREIMGNNNYSVTSQNSFPNEGEQYEYYKQAPIPAPKTGTGAFSVLAGTGCFYTTSTSGDSATTSCYWWLRSPYCNGSTSFCYVHSGGGSNTTDAYGSRGVAFGFCV